MRAAFLGRVCAFACAVGLSAPGLASAHESPEATTPVASASDTPATEALSSVQAAQLVALIHSLEARVAELEGTVRELRGAAAAAAPVEHGASAAARVASAPTSAAAAVSLPASGSTSAPAPAPEPAPAPPPAPAPQVQPPVEAQILTAEQRRTYLYGYFASRYEKVFSEPSIVDGDTVREDAPGEFTQPSFNLMLQQRVGNRFRAYVNLAGPDAGEVNVRNMWGEYSASEAFNLRIGRMYRRFGLYNEFLDAVPTYFGIEPPELFDGDHLIISRTTNLMAHGRFDLGESQLNYSLSTDNGEGDVFSGSFPVGFDLNYVSPLERVKLGVSGYSSGGRANSNVGVGDGPPTSGVLPWMEEDRFDVIGGYAEGRAGSLTLQAEYWRSSHEAVRDPDSIVAVIEGADPNARQLSRFLIDPAGPVAAANVRTAGDYTVQTAYLRAGYSVESSVGEWVPYGQWDWYSNPETIRSKRFGGDNEAGAADDGEFHKATLGIVYRPIPEVAIKLDGSSHIFRLNAETVSYPEIRFDVSYLFGR